MAIKSNAIELTLKAMELGFVKMQYVTGSDDKIMESQNAFNAKQIADFAKAISDQLTE